MIPETLLGLVLFAAAVGPGYAFTRVREQHEPQRDSSALLEAAELIVIGALITTTVAMIVLAIANECEWINSGDLAADADAYILNHPVRGLGTLLLIFLLSPLAGYGLARFIWRGKTPSIKFGTVWRSVLGRDKDTKIAWTTVELADGRAFFGQTWDYTMDPDREIRELALYKPLRQRERGQDTWSSLPNDALILAATDIRAISVSYADAPPGSTPLR